MAAPKVPAGSELALCALIIDRIHTAVVLECDLAARAIADVPVAIGA